MKKIFTVLLAIVITFTACGQKDDTEKNKFPLKTDKINSLLEENGLHMEAIELEIGGVESGTKFNYYNIVGVDDQIPYAGLSVSENQTGKIVEFSGWSLASEYFFDIANVEKAINAVCDIYGGMENNDELLKEYRAAVSDSSYISNGDNIHYWYTKYQDVYIFITFSSYTEDETVFESVVLMETDCFKQHLENNSLHQWAQEIMTQEFE